MMITKLLIANRGEIACRIIKTAQRLGVRTVAVYSTADANALHVQMADEAYCIGNPPSRESYLCGDKIIATALACGAQAIHPAYGFLSENADFVAAVEAAGLIFIGPSASAIRAMGGKSQAKALMQQAGVPLITGYHGEAQDQETLIKAALNIGLPVLLKASAGGGGKGMREVHHASELPEAIESAQREGQNSFGDSRLLVEKLLVKPRHVEVQILADKHGNCVYLFDRDCSLQRRHQKVVEEAPAPHIPQQIRQEVAASCVKACQQMKYRGAGTFEFLYEDGCFYFIEMNTRVQVEHPVTEMVTGVDIIKEQLRVAAGLGLSYQQKDIVIRGHAIECRINAEDPKTFLPCPGKINYYHAPGGLGIRMDSHIYTGYSVPPYYDSLIGKLIAFGNSREVALQRMRNALDEIVVEGIKSNIPLHRDIILTDNAFNEGGVDIHYLEKKLGLT